MLFNKKGFTLLEQLLALLVVSITITSVVLPTIQLQRNKAKVKQQYKQLILSYNQKIKEVLHEKSVHDD